MASFQVAEPTEDGSASVSTNLFIWPVFLIRRTRIPFNKGGLKREKSITFLSQHRDSVPFRQIEPRKRTAVKQVKSNGGSEWESNPPVTG